MVKRPKKFVIADDSSPAVMQAKSREQRVPSSFRVKMRILKGVPEDKLVKVWIFRDERGRQHVFWLLSGQWLQKTADRETIMNYHTRGQTRKTIIDYHEEFEQA